MSDVVRCSVSWCNACFKRASKHIYCPGHSPCYIAGHYDPFYGPCLLLILIPTKDTTEPISQCKNTVKAFVSGIADISKTSHPSSAREAGTIKWIIVARDIARGMARTVHMLSGSFETSVAPRDSTPDYVRHSAILWALINRELTY